jgi:hypothetical protein
MPLEQKGGIDKLLPQLPTEGPPLPRVLEIKWPKLVKDKVEEIRRFIKEPPII